MDEAEAPKGDDAQETPAPAPDTQAPPRLIDWSHLRGFQTVVEPGAEAPERDETYAEELAKELAARAARFVQSVDDSIVLASDGVLRWLGDPVARVVGGEDLLRPRVVLLADDALTLEDRMGVDTRLSLWIGAHVRKLLGPLEALQEASDLSESARDIARALVQALGVLERERVRNQVKTLDQTARSGLRKLGVRFGSLYLYLPNLLKPAARSLCSQLWALRRGPEAGADLLIAYASAGRTSFANEGTLSPDTYRVAGFRLCGERVVRVDIIERLSDLIRAAIPDHMRAGSRPPSEAYGFVITPQMTSLTGCAGEAFASILRSLGFENHRVKRSQYEAANRKAPIEPIRAATEAAAPASAPTTPTESAGDVATDSPHEERLAERASFEGDPEAPPETMAELDATAAPEEAASAHSSEPEPAQVEGHEGLAETGVTEAPAESPEVAAVSDLEPPQGDGESLVSPTAQAEEAHESDVAESEVREIEGAAAESSVAEPIAAEADVVDSSVTEPTVAESSVAETTVDADEEEIEIWRPAPRRPRPAPRPQRAPGEPREAGRHGGRRGDQRRHGRDPEPAPAPVAASGETAPAPAAAPDSAGEPRRYEGRKDRPDSRRHGDRPPRDGQPPRRDDARPQEAKRGPKDIPPRREPRPVVVDPDSPFAKLLALKPLLERRDKRP